MSADNQTPPTMPWPPSYNRGGPSPHLGKVDPSAFSSGLVKLLAGLAAAAAAIGLAAVAPRGCDYLNVFPRPISGIQASVQLVVPGDAPAAPTPEQGKT